jgi:hypothetical protein
MYIVIYICKKNQQHAHVFINDLIQLHCLRLVSNNQVFISRKSVHAALRYFIMQLYKQSGRYQDVVDIYQIHYI